MHAARALCERIAWIGLLGLLPACVGDAYAQIPRPSGGTIECIQRDEATRSAQCSVIGRPRTPSHADTMLGCPRVICMDVPPGHGVGYTAHVTLNVPATRRERAHHRDACCYVRPAPAGSPGG